MSTPDIPAHFAGIMAGMESAGQPGGAPPPGEPTVGELVVRIDVVATVVIALAGALGTVSSGLAKALLVPVSGAAGAIGIVAFVWSYFHAIGRSREHEISVSQLYGVAGDVAPKPVKRRLQWSLLAQVLIAIAVMVAGFSRTHPQEFNWAACIIVVPMFGMGMNGVWVSLHGRFGARILTARPSRRRKVSESHDSTAGMKQNDTHG